MIGAEATIVGQSDGRWIIRLDGGRGCKLMKTKNLVKMESQAPDLQGPEADMPATSLASDSNPARLASRTSETVDLPLCLSLEVPEEADSEADLHLFPALAQDSIGRARSGSAASSEDRYEVVAAEEEESGARSRSSSDIDLVPIEIASRDGTHNSVLSSRRPSSSAFSMEPASLVQALTCASCATTLNENDRFCSSCGQANGTGSRDGRRQPRQAAETLPEPMALAATPSPNGMEPNHFPDDFEDDVSELSDDCLSPLPIPH